MSVPSASKLASICALKRPLIHSAITGLINVPANGVRIKLGGLTMTIEADALEPSLHVPEISKQ